MNIRHECPMPDLSFAVTAPLGVQKADGTEIVAEKWTLAGLWLDPSETDVAGRVILTVPFQGVFVAFPVELRETQHEGYYVFHELTVRQRETISAFHRGVLSGRMVSTSDMITSLDTPVDLVPMGETEEEEAAGKAKEKPRLLRAIYNSALYITLALVLVTLLGNQIWTRLARINLDHARFSAPMITYGAPESGYIEHLHVKVGDVVAAGDVLVKIEDPDRESDVEDTRAEVILAERRLNAALERLARHEAEYDSQRARLWAAFYRLWAPWRVNEPRSTTYPTQLQIAWQALYDFDRGRDGEYGRYFETRDLLAESVRERELDLRRWKRDLRHKKAAADEMIVRARRAGTVFAVHAMEDNFVGRNDMLVEIEDQTPRVAVGWLDDSMATKVYVGMPADITYLHRGQSKRNEGIVTDIQAGTDVARPDKFGMIVTITADGVGIRNSRKWFRRNAPAKIELKRLEGLITNGRGDDGRT